MKRASAMASLLLAAALPGCSSARQGLCSADAGEQLCRHCNCYMPRHYNPADKCAACDCGYTYGKCVQ